MAQIVVLVDILIKYVLDRVRNNSYVLHACSSDLCGINDDNNALELLLRKIPVVILLVVEICF